MFVRRKTIRQKLRSTFGPKRRIDYPVVRFAPSVQSELRQRNTHRRQLAKAERLSAVLSFIGNEYNANSKTAGASVAVFALCDKEHELVFFGESLFVKLSFPHTRRGFGLDLSI